MVLSDADRYSRHERRAPSARLESGSAAPLLGLWAIGQSLALCWVGERLSPAGRFTLFTQNVVPDLGSQPAHSFILGVVPALLGLVLVLWKGERGRALLGSVTRIAAPLALAFALPALFTWQVGQHRPIAYLILLTLFGLSLERLLRLSFAELAALGPPAFLPRLTPLAWRFPRLSKALPLGFVALCAAAYAAYASFYTIRHHHLFQTTAFDLSIFDNLLFNTIKGHFFQSPVMFGPGHHNSISTHAEFEMVLFAPIYALVPRAETLLVIQSVFLGGAAIPLYLFARSLISTLPAVLIAVAYLLFAPLHGAQFYDFHWLPLCVFWYFWLFYAISKKRHVLSVLMVVLLFALREDLAVGLAGFGLFLFITGLRVRFGLGLTLASVAWFVLDKFVIMPWAGPWWFDTMYVGLFADGRSGYGNVVKTLISNPFYTFSTVIRGPKLAYVLHMVAPLVLLPLRRLSFWLLLLPGCVFTLMTTGYWPTVSISFQYTTHWIPFVFAASVMCLYLLRQGEGGHVREAAAVGALAVAVLSHSYNFGAVLQRDSFTGGFGRVSFAMSDEARERYADMRSVARQIPPEASVAATEYLSPHVSAREHAYIFRYDVGPVDYIFLSDKEMSGDLRNTLSTKFKKETYGLLARGKSEFFLFKRGYRSPQTSAALRHLGIRPR